MLGGRSLTRSSELEHSAFDDARNARASRAPHALNLRRELRGARLGSAQLPLQTIWHHAQSSNPEAGTRHAHAYVPMTRAAAAAAAAARCCSVVASAAAAARAAASSAAAAAAAAASASPCARRSPSAAARAAPSSVRTPARTSDALHTRTQQRNQRVHERSNKTRDIEFICMHAPRPCTCMHTRQVNIPHTVTLRLRRQPRPPQPQRPRRRAARAETPPAPRRLRASVPSRVRRP